MHCGISFSGTKITVRDLFNRSELVINFIHNPISCYSVLSELLSVVSPDPALSVSSVLSVLSDLSVLSVLPVPGIFGNEFLLVIVQSIIHLTDALNIIFVCKRD